ncbi:MAG: DEAD/DEAH box helicase, partial [Aquificae bacterium]|nr:DEAD/DEAH box helicase [Aquificota bacterium]
MTLQLIERGCPNCYGPVTDDRLSEGLPCESCLPEPERKVCTALRKLKTLKALKPYCEADSKLERFIRFFKKGVGAEPWSLQRVWAKRVFLGESFAVVAPTGVGKTTFGLVMGLFLKPKVLMIFPTRLLAQQAEEKLNELQRRLGTDRKVLLYKSTQGVRK